MGFPTVKGHCPMGCGPTLFLAAGGYVTCSWHKCPNPMAVGEILADRETEHIVKVEERDFTVRHPLRERVNDAILRCSLYDYIAGLTGPPVKPGTYRVDGDHWTEVERG